MDLPRGILHLRHHSTAQQLSDRRSFGIRHLLVSLSIPWHLWQKRNRSLAYTPYVGLRSSPYIFNQVTEVLQRIRRDQFSVHDLIHLLDDHLTAGPPASSACQQRLDIILATCYYPRVPIAPEKPVLPSTLLTFLGIELDSMHWEARLFDEKLTELRSLLDAFTACNSCTKRDLSLLGKLNFAASVVAAGHTFMRRLWDCASSMPELYHRVQLAALCKADLRWQNYLLARWNGRSFFLHHHLSLAPFLHRCTDAAGSVGHGAYYNGSWFCETWTAKQQLLHPVYGTLSDRPHVLHLGSGMVFQTDRVPFRQPGGCGRPPKRHRSLRQC